MTVRPFFIRLFAGFTALAGVGLAIACSYSGSPGTQCGTCGGGQLCDSTLGCVECLKNTDCRDPSAPLCITGRCGACASNSDCGTGKACDASHNCRAVCTNNAGCQQNGNNSNNICNTSSGACVQCLSATDCSGTGHPLCINGRCSDCGSSSDCGVANPVCDTADGRCVQCLVSSQCKGTNPVCNDHECQQGCTSNAQCQQRDTQTPICDTANGQCVECLMGSDCAVPHHCLQNQCVECIVAADCPAATPVCNMDGHCTQGGG